MTKTDAFIVVSIGDVHWGAHNPTLLYNEMNNIFLKEVKEAASTIDLITIDGDYFDKQLAGADQSYLVAFRFFYNLYSVCVEHNIQLRMLRGTITHDFNQQEIFRSFEGDIFKLYDSFVIEEICGKRCLFLPEEYPKNMEEYYQPVFDPEEKFDVAFLHGTVDFQAWQSQIIESEKHYKSAPVWSSERLGSVVNGPILCGHIHTHCSFKDKFFYHGSFSRSHYGEETEKGFQMAAIYEDGHEVVFIENILAPVKKTIKLKDIFDEFGASSNFETVIQKVNEEKALLTGDHDRLRLLIPNSYNDLAFIRMLVEYYSESKLGVDVQVNTSERIRVDVNQDTAISEVINESHSSVTEEIESEIDKFFIDGNEIATIQKFLELKSDRKYTEDQILSIIAKSKNK